MKTRSTCRIFSVKEGALRPATLLKRLQHRCFPVDFAKFLRTPIVKNICERLLPDALLACHRMKGWDKVIVEFKSRKQRQSIIDCIHVEVKALNLKKLQI